VGQEAPERSWWYFGLCALSIGKRASKAPASKLPEIRERMSRADERLTPAERTQRAILAAHTRWAKCEDRKKPRSPAVAPLVSAGSG